MTTLILVEMDRSGFCLSTALMGTEKNPRPINRVRLHPAKGRVICRANQESAGGNVLPLGLPDLEDLLGGSEVWLRPDPRICWFLTDPRSLIHLGAQVLEEV